jgi:peroxiredoxin family protein
MPGPDKLSVIVFSGTFEKVHYALVLAAAASAVGRPVTLFFTMESCRALLKPDKDGAPSWRRLPLDTGKGSGGGVDDGYAAKGLATFEELLMACVEMGVDFMVCEMGLRAMGLDLAELRDDVPLRDGGVVTFLNDASQEGAMLFV